MTRAIPKSSLLFLALLAAAVGAVFFFGRDRDRAAERYIVSRMAECHRTGGRDHCYRDAAGAFLARYPLATVMRVLARSEASPEVFSRCHEAAHFLAHREFERVKSVQGVFSSCAAVCAAGCYHGALEAHFAAKNLPIADAPDSLLSREIRSICGSRGDYDTPSIYIECVHGLGHAMMFITENDLPRSLALCDALASTFERESCYGGVFMENSSSATSQAPPRYAKADDPLYPCTAVEPRYRKVCYTYQSSYFYRLGGSSWSRNVELCGRVPAEYRRGCFWTMGSNQVGSSRLPLEMKAGCDSVSSAKFRDVCYRGVAAGLVGRYSGNAMPIIGFCSVLGGPNREHCYRQLGFDLRSWTRDGRELASRCRLIPEEQYVSWCLNPRVELLE